MASLAYRRMNFTLQTMEHERNRQDAEWYRNLPEIEKAERTHYWHIQRKARRGGGWKTQGEYYTTKREMAQIWVRNFRGKAGYRLRHLLAY